MMKKLFLFIISFCFSNYSLAAGGVGQLYGEAGALNKKFNELEQKIREYSNQMNTYYEQSKKCRESFNSDSSLSNCSGKNIDSYISGKMASFQLANTEREKLIGTYKDLAFKLGKFEKTNEYGGIKDPVEVQESLKFYSKWSMLQGSRMDLNDAITELKEKSARIDENYKEVLTKSQVCSEVSKCSVIKQAGKQLKANNDSLRAMRALFDGESRMATLNGAPADTGAK